MLRSRLTAFALAAALVVAPLTAEAADKSGSFTGASNHVTKGTAKIVRKADGYYVEVAGDFWFDGAPDPKLSLGKGGKVDKATLVENLRANSGAQSYKLPAGVDGSTYDTVILWCEKFSVPLGIAAVQ
jgi:hypothetical protein